MKKVITCVLCTNCAGNNKSFTKKLFGQIQFARLNINYKLNYRKDLKMIPRTATNFKLSHNPKIFLIFKQPQPCCFQHGSAPYNDRHCVCVVRFVLVSANQLAKTVRDSHNLSTKNRTTTKLKPFTHKPQIYQKPTQRCICVRL